MRTLQKILLSLAILIPVSLFGQVTYTFESGSNGGTSDAGASYMNMVPYGTTTLATMENQTLATLAAPAGADGNTSLVFHGKTKLSGINMMTVDLTAFTGSADQQVVWKTYLKAANVATRAGVILRAQSSATGYSTGARQGYYFSVVGTTTSGTVSYRITKLTSAGTVTDLKAATNAAIAGFTTGPLYLRAKAVGTTLTLEYSTNGTTYTQFTGASVTDAAFASGTVQLTYGLGGGSNLDQYVDDVTITNLSVNPTVTLNGNDKYTYTGSAQGPNDATPALFTGTPTLTYSYQGIGSTSYTSSSTRPTNAGTYAAIVVATSGAQTARDTLAYEILPTTASQYYTFNDDVLGSVAANTTNNGVNHTVATTIGSMFGYKTKGKMLQSTGNAVTTLTNFGTSTDYSVVWKDFASATTQKRAIILRGDASNTISDPGTGTTNTGLGYMFYVNNTGATTMQMDIRRMSPTAAATSLSNNTAVTYDGLNKPTWFKASVVGSSIKFEYSTNGGATWTTACSATDATYTSGLTQISAVNFGGASYSFDYFGYKNLVVPAVTITGNNKYVYDNTPKGPASSTYASFSSAPTVVYNYVGINGTSYAQSATAPSASGHYAALAVATYNSEVAKDTLAYDILPTLFANETRYDFTSDAVGSTPAGVTYPYATAAGTGVVATYSGRDITGYKTSGQMFKPVTAGTKAGTGVADLGFAASSSYSVTWKEFYSSTGGKKGFLLMGQADSSAYANGMKRGYYFSVYNDPTVGTQMRMYKATDADTLVILRFDTIANPGANVPRWFRATVNPGVQKFEYSNDGVTWTQKGWYGDMTYTSAGTTQAVYGLRAPVGAYYYDYILFEKDIPTSTIAPIGNKSNFVRVQGNSVTVDADKYEVYGSTGLKVKESSAIKTFTLKSGIYIVKTNIGVQKIVVR